MNKLYIVSFLFIILGVIVAIYFFVLGWYLIGGFGCGLVWGGVELLNSFKVDVIRSEIVTENNENYIKVWLNNVSSKKGDVFVVINIIENNQVVASITSETISLNAHGNGIVKAKIVNRCEEIKNIKYEITRIVTKKY